MLRAKSDSPTSEEDSDDVFLTESYPPLKYSLPPRKAKTTSDSYYNMSTKIHTLKDINMSLDSDEFSEPYKRRGSSTRLEKRRPSGNIKSSTYVTFAEILSHFQNQDPVKVQKILSEQDAKKGKILGIFSPHPKLSLHLETEKDILLLMAETKYDRNEPIHLLVLQSLYSRIMGGPLTCPSLGDHWTDIGFNHSDPSIDLSAAKMLGAIQLLFFVTQYSNISDDVFNLSVTSYQGFPFALVGLNFTRTIVRLVRKESLNRHFIRQKQLIYIVMELYCAVWYKFYNLWRNNDPNIQDLNAVTTSLEHDILLKPLSLLSQFNKGIRRCNSHGRPTTATNSTGVTTKLSFLRRGLKLSSSSTNLRTKL